MASPPSSPPTSPPSSPPAASSPSSSPPPPSTQARPTASTRTARAVAAGLNEDLAGLRMIRDSTRVKVYGGLAVLSKRLATLLPPADAKPVQGTRERIFVRITLYITRPRGYGLTARRFHVLAAFGTAATYAFTAHVQATPAFGGILARMRFTAVEYTPLPDPLPDAEAEAPPPAPEVCLDPYAFTSLVRTPDRHIECVELGPGAWWSAAEKKLYMLLMDETLLALCPAGWRARGLGAVLQRLLSHPEGCEECATPPHADPVNLRDAPTALRDACPCACPCRRRAAREREVRVAGDAHLHRVLFMSMVHAVRFADTRRRPRLTRSPSDLIMGLNEEAETVPVNDAGWKLVEVAEEAAAALICGCPLLRVACTQTPCIRGLRLWL